MHRCVPQGGKGSWPQKHIAIYLASICSLILEFIAIWLATKTNFITHAYRIRYTNFALKPNHLLMPVRECM